MKMMAREWNKVKKEVKIFLGVRRVRIIKKMHFTVLFLKVIYTFYDTVGLYLTIIWWTSKEREGEGSY